MFYRQAAPPPPPKNKCKQYTGKCWYFCVKFKINCSLWLLLVFAAFMVYLNDNYINLTISLPDTINIASSSSSPTTSKKTNSMNNELSYLHPFAFRSVGYGTCPYTMASYPNVGPSIPFICPSNKPYRIGSAWYLKEDLLDGDNEKTEKNDKDEKDKNKPKETNIDKFFAQFEIVKSVMENNTDSKEKGINKRLKKVEGLHLSYLYTSCQTKKEVETIHNEWNDIIKSDEYESIFKEYGYESWTDIEVCFDRILCMNDNHYGGVTYGLYLDDKSQELMHKLVAKTEEIQMDNYNIDLTFKRIEQQSFHITLGTITNTKDYNAFDGKKLMDLMNQQTMNKFPCIKLSKQPPIQDYICKNKKTLQKTLPKFEWDCTDLR